jgi:hypothetical protein
MGDVILFSIEGEGIEKKAIHQRQRWFVMDSREDIKLIIEECKRYLKKYKTDEDIEKINDQLTLEAERKFGPRPRNSTTIKKEKVTYEGYIYFLQDDIGRTKIGKTKDIDKRIFNIGILLPKQPILFHFFKTQDMTKSEKELHKKYIKYRLDGEWFNLPKKELDKIKIGKQYGK